MKTSGLVHLYCGDGKGKTTAAVAAVEMDQSAGFHAFPSMMS